MSLRERTFDIEFVAADSYTIVDRDSGTVLAQRAYTEGSTIRYQGMARLSYLEPESEIEMASVTPLGQAMRTNRPANIEAQAFGSEERPVDTQPLNRCRSVSPVALAG